MDRTLVFIDEGFVYKLSKHFGKVKEDYPQINKIIIISSDTDFCPVIRDIKKRGIEVLLFTYFDRIRNSPFSLSNELLTCCSRFYKITKQDFDNASLEK